MKIGVLVLTVTLFLAVGTSASAATGSVDIREVATAIQGGSAALVFVEVECSLDPGDVLLEGHVSVLQDDAFGMAGLTPVCDGRRHLYPVRVSTFGGEFEAGQAFASAFLLFLNADGTTTSVSDFTVVTIRGAPA